MHYLKLRNKNDNFIWPSFVDALASLLIVIIFILMIFVISQYYISQKLSGKDQVLNHLEAKILETEVAIKGQTASSSYKPAILNNGLKIQVPPFINTGDEIVFDSRTLEYLKKI